MKVIFFFVLISSGIVAQNADSIFIRSIYNQALSKGKAYEDLRSLCKDVGARLSGSSEAAIAVQWGKERLEINGFENVYLQEVKVPHWERGTKESGWINSKSGLRKINILALGGSIGTNGLLEAEVIEFKSLVELQKASKSKVQGKIVFINQPMNEQFVNTFNAYGGCYSIRGEGAIEASRLGAVGVIIRSVTLPIDLHPHTGSLHYLDSVIKIPSAAISTVDSEELSKLLVKGKVKFSMELDCRVFPDELSYNVIAEIKGVEKPNEVITVGAHLDSWDTGEGAHDDGAGIVHSMEALRILKELNYRPKHTIRVVFFMNEENGNKGGIAYAKWSEERGENHLVAIESDRGGFTPRGFDCDGSNDQIEVLKIIGKNLNEYDLFHFERGFGGVDIGPLKKSFEKIMLIGFVPDSQRYFDFHHAETDVFESVNKRELELGCAAISSMLYMLDKKL